MERKDTGDLILTLHEWNSARDFDIYRNSEQQRPRWIWAHAQTRLDLHCLHIFKYEWRLRFSSKFRPLSLPDTSAYAFRGMCDEYRNLMTGQIIFLICQKHGNNRAYKLPLNSVSLEHAVKRIEKNSKFAPWKLTKCVSPMEKQNGKTWPLIQRSRWK